MQPKRPCTVEDEEEDQDVRVSMRIGDEEEVDDFAEVCTGNSREFRWAPKVFLERLGRLLRGAVAPVQPEEYDLSAAIPPVEDDRS